MPNQAVVQRLDSLLVRKRAALPAPAARRIDAISAQLPLLESRLAETAILDPLAQDARRLMGKHLPELIERYERVPAAYRARARRRGADRRRAARPGPRRRQDRARRSRPQARPRGPRPPSRPRAASSRAATRTATAPSRANEHGLRARTRPLRDRGLPAPKPRLARRAREAQEAHAGAASSRKACGGCGAPRFLLAGLLAALVACEPVRRRHRLLHLAGRDPDRVPDRLPLAVLGPRAAGAEPTAAGRARRRCRSASWRPAPRKGCSTAATSCPAAPCPPPTRSWRASHELQPHLGELDPASTLAGDARRLIGQHLPRLVDSYLELPASARAPGSESSQRFTESLDIVAGELDSLLETCCRDRQIDLRHPAAASSRPATGTTRG